MLQIDEHTDGRHACKCYGRTCLLGLLHEIVSPREIITEETVILDADVSTMDDIAELVKKKYQGKLTEEQRNTVSSAALNSRAAIKQDS